MKTLNLLFLSCVATGASAHAASRPAPLTRARLESLKSSSNDPSGDAFVDSKENLNALVDGFVADSSLASPMYLYLAANTAALSALDPNPARAAVSPLTAAGDASKGTVRVEAVVLKYEDFVMEDALGHGRYVTYDAVTLKMVSPAGMVDKTVRVYVEGRSLADSSPLRKPGERFRFDFAKTLLKGDRQLFEGALENLQWIGVPPGDRCRQPQAPGTGVKT